LKQFPAIDLKYELQNDFNDFYQFPEQVRSIDAFLLFKMTKRHRTCIRLFKSANGQTPGKIPSRQKAWLTWARTTC